MTLTSFIPKANCTSKILLSTTWWAILFPRFNTQPIHSPLKIVTHLNIKTKFKDRLHLTSLHNINPSLFFCQGTASAGSKLGLDTNLKMGT